MAFADKWDLCDVTSYWRILAARRRALRVAAPGRFIVVQAGQMRLIRVHHEREVGLNIVPQLSLDGPTSSSHQRCELAVVPPYLERRPLAAPGRHLLARSASFTRAAPPARDPRKPGPPLR